MFFIRVTEQEIIVITVPNDLVSNKFHKFPPLRDIKGFLILLLITLSDHFSLVGINRLILRRNMELTFSDVASGRVCGRCNLLSEISEDFRIAEHLVRRNAQNNKGFKQVFEKR